MHLVWTLYSANKWVQWTFNFGIGLIKLHSEHKWSSLRELIRMSRPPQCFSCQQQWRSSVAPGLYSCWRPYKRSASGVSDLWGSEPNTSFPPLSPRLDGCAHCTMSRRVCDFTVWVGSRDRNCLWLRERPAGLRGKRPASQRNCVLCIVCSSTIEA